MSNSCHHTSRVELRHWCVGARTNSCARRQISCFEIFVFLPFCQWATVDCDYLFIYLEQLLCMITINSATMMIETIMIPVDISLRSVLLMTASFCSWPVNCCLYIETVDNITTMYYTQTTTILSLLLSAVSAVNCCLSIETVDNITA